MARRALPAASLALVRAVDALPPGAWLLACSGGADSLALAWAAAHVAGRRGTPVRAVVVDHGLQPGSHEVTAEVVVRLHAVGVDAEVVRAHVADTGGGLEASAREARYAAIEAVRRPDEVVLLGHTRDDQAESVLLGLARGSGLASLAGMASERGALRRPLLGITREQTRATCAEQGLVPWDDPMNADRGFARVRVREVVLPVLEAELGPGIRDALARTAAINRGALDVVRALAGETPSELVTDCLHLAGLHPGLRRQVLGQWLAEAGASEVTAGHVAAVERLVTDWRGQKGVDVPGGRVVRRDGRLAFVNR